MLREVLSADLVKTHFRATSREAAVREAGRLLVEKGLATSDYADAMVDNLTTLGVYSVIAPGIAMPHARPERGAIGIGFSIVTLVEPVVFGHPKNDPVTLVVGLCAVDHQAHLAALSELAEILSDRERVQRITSADTAGDVIQIINEGK